jgi:hypothetical protein
MRAPLTAKALTSFSHSLTADISVRGSNPFESASESTVSGSPVMTML